MVELSENASMVYEYLNLEGRSSLHQIVEGTGLLPVEVEEAFTELVTSKKLVVFRKKGKFCYESQLGLDRPKNRMR